MKKYLLYTLINFHTKPYLQRFEIFLKSILLFSDSYDYDILILCSKNAKESLQKMDIIKLFNNIKYLVIEDSQDLYHALLSKCDIANYKDILKYEKVLYIDCDIIIQCNLNDIFNNAPLKQNLLYAPAEGTITGRHWYLNSYTESNIERLEKQGTKSFNSGEFMFIPTKKFLQHFKNVKKLGENFKGKKHFYDQSFFNYYFNIHNLSCTDYMTDIVKMFPENDKFYPNKCILHFAGIGRYMKKAKIMQNYLNKLRLVKK